MIMMIIKQSAEWQNGDDDFVDDADAEDNI